MTRRTLALLAAGAFVLAACGDDSDADSTLPPADTPATVQDLSGQTFTATEISGYSLVEGSELTMSFDGDQLSANAGCNTLAGGYTLDGGEFAGGPFAMTTMACDQALMDQDQWLVDLLSTGPGMTLVGPTLTIEGLDGTVVTMTAETG
ncbi:MAG: META domain-containing protein [Actinomycetota bacterium]